MDLNTSINKFLMSINNGKIRLSIQNKKIYFANIEIFIKEYLIILKVNIKYSSTIKYKNI